MEFLECQVSEPMLHWQEWILHSCLCQNDDVAGFEQDKNAQDAYVSKLSRDISQFGFVLERKLKSKFVLNPVTFPYPPEPHDRCHWARPRVCDYGLDARLGDSWMHAQHFISLISLPAIHVVFPIDTELSRGAKINFLAIIFQDFKLIVAFANFFVPRYAQVFAHVVCTLCASGRLCAGGKS